MREPAEEVTRLNERVASLESENRRLSDVLATQRAAIKKMAGAAGVILAGPSLTASTLRLFEGIRDRTGDLVERGAEFCAALIRRIIRVGSIGLLVALLPGLVAIWQNLLIRDQNRLLLRQGDQIGQQIKHQRKEFYDRRRTELLAHLYGTFGDGGIGANIRIRQEALREFVELERAQTDGASDSILIDLSHCDLGGISIVNTTFRRVQFDEASLNNAKFYNCIFEECTFLRTKMEETEFTDCAFKDLHFWEPIAKSVIFHDSVFDSVEITLRDYYNFPSLSDVISGKVDSDQVVALKVAFKRLDGLTFFADPIMDLLFKSSLKAKNRPDSRVINPEYTIFKGYSFSWKAVCVVTYDESRQFKKNHEDLVLTLWTIVFKFTVMRPFL